MRRVGTLLLSGAAFFAALNSAYADDAFDAFQKICLETRGDNARSVLAADGSGWMAMPDAMLANFPKGDVTNVVGRLRSTPTSLTLLIVGKGSGPFEAGVGGNVNFCAIAAIPSDPQFVELAGKLAAVPADGSSPAGQAFFFWQEKDGVHVQVKKDSPDMGTLLKSGALTALLTRSDNRLSMVALAAPGGEPEKAP